MSLPNHGHTPAKAAAVAGVSPVTAERFIQTALREWAYLPACLLRQAAGRRQSLSNLKTTRPGPAIMDA